MNVQRIALVGSLAAVAAAIAAGLLIGGSPAEQRLRRLDERRVAELRQLASAAERRWEREQRLPAADELVDGQFLTRLPTDPRTGQPYEYRLTGPRQFEVCATFDRPSRPELAGDFWAHEAGHRCFSLSVTESRR